MEFDTTFSPDELQILQERAQRIAAATVKQGEADTLSVLMLTINNERYAMPVSRLRTVYEGVSVVAVPCTPAFVSGIANVRGYMITVLHLGQLLDIPDTDGDGNVLIVVSNAQMTVGYRVDAIGDVRNFKPDDLAGVPANFEGGQASYVKNILPDGTALLDIDALLDDPNIIIDQN